MGKKIVALIDCQNDFIDGALGVGYDKWAEAYNYIEENLLNKEKFDDFVFTLDSHPVNHCSFKEQGGIWPAHCVIATSGVKLYWKLYDFINDGGSYGLIHKGVNPLEEEYGADVLKGQNDVEEVHIAGLCTDYCVKESSIMTANAHPDTKVFVHLKGSAYIAEDTKNAAIEQMKKVPNIELVY